MIIIINVPNLKVGGGVQVALSIIQECIHFPKNIYHVFISEAIALQLEKIDFPDFFYFHLFKFSACSYFKLGFTIWRQVKLEREIVPDCVFTVFGPSYWTPKTPHLLGFAQGYYLYPESIFFKRIRIKTKVKIASLRIIHRFFFRRNANSYFVESEDAKKRLAQYLNISLDKIYTISNTHHPVFLKNSTGSNFLGPRTGDEIRLITISSYYEHKNLEIINEVLPFLRMNRKWKFIFYLTIEQKDFNRIFSNSDDSIINLGPIPIELCKEAYSESDFVFMPTLIEIFTASYPEAMRMKKPILTSDLPFAHSICGNGAEYFNPLDGKDIASKIISLTGNKKRYNELIENGVKRLSHFETSRSRAEKLIQICEDITKKHSDHISIT